MEMSYPTFEDEFVYAVDYMPGPKSMGFTFLDYHAYYGPDEKLRMLRDDAAFGDSLGPEEPSYSFWIIPHPHVYDMLGRI